VLKKENGKKQEIMMLKEPYELQENKVVLKLSNEVLKITFDHLKSDLQGYLRKSLKNNKIILEAEVMETAREDMIYTNKEKFAHLVKKYPDLKDLQERLGLDPDY
jgi:DNA polymerase-3 subunit gamma/tau